MKSPPKSGKCWSWRTTRRSGCPNPALFASLHLNGGPTISSEPRTRSLPSRVAIGVAWAFASIFLLAVAFWLYGTLTLGSRVQHRLEALRQRGEPTTMAEAAPKPVPGALNAAPLYQSVFKVNFEPGAPSDSSLAGLTGDELEQVADFRKTPSPELLAQVRPLLARRSTQQALQTLKRAADKPYSVFPLRWDEGTTGLYPHLAKFRNAERLVMAQALVSAADGKPSEAAEWLWVGLRFPRHVMQEPTLIAQLCAYAMSAIVTDTVPSVLADGDLPFPATARLRAELAAADLKAALRQALLTERVIGLNMSDQQVAGVEREVTSSAATRALTLNLVARPFWQLQQLLLLNRTDKLIPQTLKPFREAPPAPAADDMKVNPLDMSAHIVPIYAKVGANRDQCQARLSMMRIALALNDYHYAHKGCPKTLSQLPQPLPQDPFSGKDFVYRRTEGGYLLYSIGQNLKDDGGTVAQKSEDRTKKGDLVWGE